MKYYFCLMLILINQYYFNLMFMLYSITNLQLHLYNNNLLNIKIYYYSIKFCQKKRVKLSKILINYNYRIKFQYLM